MNPKSLTQNAAPSVPSVPSRAAVPRRSAVAIAALLLMSGCASFQRPLAAPEKVYLNTGEARTVVDTGSDSSIDIDAGFASDDLFMLKPMVDTGVLPAVQLQGLSVTESGVYDALRLVLKDTGISLNIEGGSKGSERFGQIAAFDVRGNLTEVMDNLSESIGFFYSYRKNTLFIQQEQQFVIELPPALSEDNAAGLTNTLQFLGAKDPYIDRLNRSLVFRTNRPSLAKIGSYLQKIRDTRSLIIYDVNIFQVDLRDNSDTGIQWNRLAWASAAGQAAAPMATAPLNGANGTGTVPNTGNGAVTPTGPGAALAPIGKAISGGLTGLGLGLVLSSSRFSIDMLVDFLQTQGNVKAISRPRLAVISGTKGTLRVGQSTTYVSKVGTNFSTSVSQVTTETKDLKTGLDLALAGDFSDNTVYTRVGLSISEIVSLNKFTALGTDLILPTTADREINTIIRARPGDLFLLGGININRDSSEARRGITQNGTSDVVTRSELVLAIKAKVVNFRGREFQSAQAKAAAPRAEVPPPVVPVQSAPPPPAPPGPTAISMLPVAAPIVPTVVSMVAPTVAAATPITIASNAAAIVPIDSSVTVAKAMPAAKSALTAAKMPAVASTPIVRIKTVAAAKPVVTSVPVTTIAAAVADKRVMSKPLLKPPAVQPGKAPVTREARTNLYPNMPLRLAMSTVIAAMPDYNLVVLAKVPPVAGR